MFFIGVTNKLFAPHLEVDILVPEKVMGEIFLKGPVDESRPLKTFTPKPKG